ncbi:MAG TPA: LamG domain-containing protein, partial [Phycisphaerae bacterium]|nr:LamG domain-containing protein [Phycisphaerae bacterium]
IYRLSQGPYPGRERSPFVNWGGTGLGQHFKGGKIPAEVVDVPLETLDWGEVWAMQEFMRRIMPDDLQLPEDGYWVWQNGWWAGLWNPKTEILDTLRDAGIHDIMTAHTWYGRGNHPNAEPYLTQMRIKPPGFPMDEAVAGMPGPAGPAAGWHSPQEVKLDQFKPGQFTPDFRAPPAMEKFIEYGRKIGVHVSSFATPGIWFDRKPEWGSIDEDGKPSVYLFGRKVSCWANDDYMRHMLALHEGVFAKYQPRWWGWDGRWLSHWEVGGYRPGPQGAGLDPCYAKNHGHLPGDNLYKEWKNIQNFLRELRRRYPRMCLESYYGLHRGGPWALRHLNSAYNYYENNGADMNRLQAWHQQNDRFRPVYKNCCDVFGKQLSDFQFNVISALSMSTYCMIGPGFHGLKLKENREFLKKWRGWGTTNHAYLKVKRDLFDCPGDSPVDGSAHIIKDRGFLFLFPGGFDKKINHSKIVRASVPINRWLGLDEKPAALYQIKEVYPREGIDLGVYRYGEKFLYDIPKDSAVVLELNPAKPGETSSGMAYDPNLPASRVQVVRAFDGGTTGTSL